MGYRLCPTYFIPSVAELIINLLFHHLAAWLFERHMTSLPGIQTLADSFLENA